MTVAPAGSASWGFGGAGIASLAVPIDDATGAATVHAAWEAGVRYFDTAPHYGLGLSEQRLGASLAARDRDAFVVSTKVGRLLRDGDEERDDLPIGGFAVRSRARRVWDFSPEGVAASLAESRQRLGFDRIDVAFLHDPEEHDLRDGLERALPALGDRREAGEVRRIGVGSKSVDALLAAVRTGLPDVVMVAGRWTLLDRTAGEELLPLCAERGVDVVAVGVFNSGALSVPEPDGSLPFEYGAMPPDVLDRVRRLAAVCGRHGVALPAAAVAFPRRHPAVTDVVLGVQTPQQVAEDAAHATARVPDALWTELEDEGLL